MFFSIKIIRNGIKIQAYIYIYISVYAKQLSRKKNPLVCRVDNGLK